MSTETDGGPAFPCETFGHDAGIKPGMSLRDWFAGQALVGIISASQNVGVSAIPAVAGAAYKVADAMLDERAKAVRS